MQQNFGGKIQENRGELTRRREYNIATRLWLQE
jgi:hypothetical protein